jgi:branched-chain amino acid transport system substrate-binding protein
MSRRAACALTSSLLFPLSFASRLSAQQPPIRIGLISTLSGAFANANELYQATVKAFQHVHGESAGGRRVEVIFRDDTGIAPETARRLAQELIIGEHVDFLVGFTFSPNAAAVRDISTQSKVPVLITNASTTNLLANAPYMSRFSYTQGQLTSIMAAWALKNKIKRIYNVFLDFSTGYEAKADFSKTFTAGGGVIVGEVAFPISTIDFSTYVQRVHDAAPEAVFAFLATAGRGFLKAFHDAGLHKSGIRVIGTGDLVTENLLPSIGEYADGVITAMNYSDTHNSALNRSVIAAVKAADPSVPPFSFTSAALWDALTAIYRVVDAQKGSLDPDKTMALIKGMSFESPRGPIRIDPDTRDIVQNIYIRRTQLLDGKWANVEIDTFLNVKDPVEH